MKNIAKYQDFLNESQLEFPFMDDIRKQEEITAKMKRMAEEREEQIKFFRNHLSTKEHLEKFLSLNPTRQEIAEVKAQVIERLDDCEYVLKLIENGELVATDLDPERIKNLIPRMKDVVKKMKSL